MSDHSSIEWTEATWNPVTGCTKVSPGCDHCYAETIAHRFAGTKAYPDGFEVTLHPDRLDKPLRWRKPRKVFVNSMSDLFHDDVPDDFIARVFAVMALAPQHTFQVLTKRHGRMRSLLGNEDFRHNVAHEASERAGEPPFEPCPTFHHVWDAWPLPNVWLGVSVETQQWADIRIPALLDTPAAVRFLSCEPLLGPVNLQHSLNGDRSGWRHLSALDWVIVGGESGPGARPMHPEWARSLRDQCQTERAAFFFKQWGEWAPRVEHAERPLQVGGDLYLGETETAELQVVRRVGKKAAGRELDGRTWDEMPGDPS